MVGVSMSKLLLIGVVDSGGRRILRPSNIIPLVALVIFGALLSKQIAGLERASLLQAISNMTAGQWMLASVFTVLSFRAVGSYDVLVHRLLGTGAHPTEAKRSGVLAIILAQTLGFGAITGAFVRWRCLPNLGPTVVARLSAVVSISFLASLAVIGGLVIPMSGLMPITPSWLLIGVSAVCALFLTARLAYQQRWIPQPLTIALMTSLLGATFFDTIFAAAALWVLWPDPTSFHLVFAAYLVALAAGLVSNCPGGLGAFDLTLLGLLQTSDANGAVAAIISFRAIYYFIPAVLALVILIRPRPEISETAVEHPEATLSKQSANVTLVQNTPTLTLPCWGRGAVYGDFPNPNSLPPLPLYKCSGRQALIARTAGWSVLRCAEVALIDLNNWTLNGPARRQLRRALNSFAKCDLHIRPARVSDDLAPVANAWNTTHGGEKGLSMGRYHPEYLRHQKVFVALKDTTPVAFVSFHTFDGLWTLDIMRHVDALPKGTMHALITAAIDDARSAGIKTLSLAAAPAPETHLIGARRIHRKSAGLRRFKSAFAPRWVPRYICAKSPVFLGLTMITLAWKIHRPPPLPNLPQANHENYSFAPPTLPCEGHPSL